MLIFGIAKIDFLTNWFIPNFFYKGHIPGNSMGRNFIVQSNLGFRFESSDNLERLKFCNFFYESLIEEKNICNLQ